MAILADSIFKCILLNENDNIQIQISLKLVPGSPIDNKSAFVQVMAWHWKATSHYLNKWWPSSLMHICGTRGRWVNRHPIAQPWLRYGMSHMSSESHLYSTTLIIVLCAMYFFSHDQPWISSWIRLISNRLDITVQVIVSQLSGQCYVISRM